jgi:hypothetical protein
MIQRHRLHRAAFALADQDGCAAFMLATVPPPPAQAAAIGARNAGCAPAGAGA